MGRRAAARRAHVSDADALTPTVDELASELGSLRVAHANAAILTQSATISDLDLDEWHRVLAVNLTGVLLIFRAVLPHFEAEGGLLLATGSSTALGGIPGGIFAPGEGVE